MRIHRLDDFDAVTLEGGRRPIIVDVRTGDSTDQP
jgi:hypothetical protein